MTRSPRSLLACLFAGLFLTPAPAPAQDPGGPELPVEVREWLERDQMRRWAGMIQQGDSIFNSGSCRRCHGTGGAGGRNGPDLTDSTWAQSDGSLDGIRSTIFWGIREDLLSDASWRFPMNPAGGLHLEPDQLDALAAYVWTLSNGTHLPGR